MANALAQGTSARAEQVVTEDTGFYVRRSQAEAKPWDTAVVNDLLGFDYVRLVLFSDGLGRVLHAAGRDTDTAAERCEGIDLAMAALQQMGRGFAVGELTISVNIFPGGTLVTAVQDDLLATVIAGPKSNLGQLLSHTRRLLTEAHD